MSKTKIAILSDIHANLEAFNAVLDVLSTMDITHYVCIGDIVGYNANPRECLDLMMSLNPISCIMGNHDEYAGADHELYGFNPQAAEAITWTRNQLTADDRKLLLSFALSDTIRMQGLPTFMTVHGTLDCPELWGYVTNKLQAMASMANQIPYKLCFYGHSHKPMFFEKNEEDTKGYYLPDNSPFQLKPNNSYMVNVGSIGQPRDGDPRAAFTVYCPEDATVQLYRVEYDIASCQKKIIDAGLPQRLADRLAVGK